MILEDMPIEYYGKIKKGCGYTNTNPRDWTEKEIQWIQEKKKQGFTNKQIAEKINRTEVSISIKLKRLGKTNNTYNKRHVEEKENINIKFIEEMKPKTLLDLYCGGGHTYYKDLIATKNDLDLNIKDADYHEDAFKLICKLYSHDKKYDIIDLDPYGSAYDCFDLAIKMANKGLIITLGELGHKRWKRLDFVSTHYDINNLEDFTIENIINYIIKIGKRNKKQLIVKYQKEWQNIGRVWFEIKPLKITKQWEK